MEQLSDDLQSIIGAYDPRLNDSQRRYLIESIKQALQVNWDQIQRSLESNLRDAVHPMLSFRDIDESLDFVADGAAGIFVDRIRTS